jgi:hypothetical protein
VAALAVVEDLDEVEHGGLQCLAGWPVVAVEQLAFQGGEEACLPLRWWDDSVLSVPDNAQRGRSGMRRSLGSISRSLSRDEIESVGRSMSMQAA